MMQKRMCQLAVAAGLVFTAWAGYAQDRESESTVRINGFGSLGGVHSSTDFGGSFRRDMSQPYQASTPTATPDSRLGIQGNFSVNAQLDLAAQVVAKDRVLSNGAKDSLEWLYASYRPVPDLTLRIGRTSPDLFLLSDYRNVGFAYLTARPSVDFYGVLPLEGLDGVDITKSWHVGDDLWRIKGAVGKSHYRLSNPTMGSVRVTIESVIGLTLSRESNGLLVRATLAKLNAAINSPDLDLLTSGLNTLSQLPLPTVAAEAKYLSYRAKMKDMQGTYASAGLSYDRNGWVGNAEIFRTRTNASAPDMKAGYFNVGRRFNDLTAYIGLGEVKSIAGPVALPQWSPVLTPIIGPTAAANAQLLGTTVASGANQVRVDQRTWTVGVRWDFHPQVALKLQWDRTKAASGADMLWSKSGGTANVGTVVFDFMF